MYLNSSGRATFRSLRYTGAFYEHQHTLCFAFLGLAWNGLRDLWEEAGGRGAFVWGCGVDGGFLLYQFGPLHVARVRRLVGGNHLAEKMG